MRAPALALALLLGMASSAAADGFDDAVKAATPLHDGKSMAALFWSQQASCKAKSDLLRRQCEGVRAARRSEVGGRTYVVNVGAPAIEAATEIEARSVTLTLRSCLSCEEEGPVIVGQGAHELKGGSVLATKLFSKTEVFKEAARAEHWGKFVAPRLRAQFLVKLPKSMDSFKVGPRPGYKLEVVGHRLYDPCKGQVFDAKPASKRGPVDTATCKSEPAYEEAPKVVDKEGEGEPDRLTTVQIKAAMATVMEQADKCYEAYGIEGKATFKMVIAGSGELASAVQSGDFEGTPTGICLDKAMEMATFPKSKKKETPISYPIILQ